MPMATEIVEKSRGARRSPGSADHAVVRPGPGAHELEDSCIWMMSPSSPVNLGNGRPLRFHRRARELHDELTRRRSGRDRCDGHRHAGPADQLLETRGPLRADCCVMVAIEPRGRYSWPAACRRLPRRGTRRRMMRSGRMRSAFLTSSRWRISPLPRWLGGRVSMRATCGAAAATRRRPRMVIRRSLSEIKESALSMVVLPEPVPPEMMVVMRARPPRQHFRIWGLMALYSTRLFRLNGFLENLRIDTSGPSTADRAGSQTLTREPSRQACVEQRMRCRRPGADRRRQSVDDAQEVGLVLEAHAAGLQQPPRST